MFSEWMRRSELERRIWEILHALRFQIESDVSCMGMPWPASDGHGKMMMRAC